MMNISSKDLPDLQIDTSFTSPQGNAAAQRALDYYLKPAVSEPETDERFFNVKGHLSGEEAIFRKLDEQAGQRYLVPLNPTWPKTLLTDECRIIGVVVQATARY